MMGRGTHVVALATWFCRVGVSWDLFPRLGTVVAFATVGSHLPGWRSRGEQLSDFVGDGVTSSES